MGFLDDAKDAAETAGRKIKEALLERLPLENVFVLKGGWQAWRQATKP